MIYYNMKVAVEDDMGKAKLEEMLARINWSSSPTEIEFVESVADDTDLGMLIFKEKPKGS